MESRNAWPCWVSCMLQFLHRPGDIEMMRGAIKYFQAEQLHVLALYAVIFVDVKA